MEKEKTQIASNPTSSKSSGQTAIDRFAEMMISRMEEIKNQPWEKGWITPGASQGLPQNFSGRNYSGGNSFFLMMHMGLNNYSLPVFLTFNQARNLNTHVLKGEKAFPVMYWDIFVRDPEGKKVSYDKYKEMPEEQRKQMTVIPFTKSFPVYNIDQTNFREVHPERYKELCDKFKAPEIRDEQGMYSHAGIDRLIEKQEWVCPIKADAISDRAFYSPSRDMINIPHKSQFKIGSSEQEIYTSGMEYYSTLLHEMTHSTMTPDRLNREVGHHFGSPKYAKEELVAELSAAMIGHGMGFDKKITDNNAAYLDNWISALKKEPKFIISVMTDVSKATDMILTHIDRQNLALNLPCIVAKNNPAAMDIPPEQSQNITGSIFKSKSGEYAIRASLGGESLGVKAIDSKTADRYFSLTGDSVRQVYLNQQIRHTFSSEIAAHAERVSKNLSHQKI